MKISFNPSNSNKNILDLIKNNKDIIFDLKGHSIFARGVEFKGTDTNTWRPVVDNLTSDSTTSSLSAKQGKVLKALIDGKSNSDHNHDGRYVRAFGTSNDNIDSDWGQSFKTFDPIPLGTPPEKNPNISLLSIGENFNRRKQLAFIWNNDNIYYRRRIDSGFTNWRRLAFANEIPTSLKNPYALTISLNGTSQGPYDGSAAKNINITPGSIGAAVSNHSHDYLVVNSADDKSFNSAYHNFQVLYADGGNGITGKPANVDAFGLFKFRAASGGSGQMLLANGGSLYIRSSEDAKMTNTLAWKTILDSSNYSGILDSRYYTELEVNSLLSRKLDRVNLTTGSWNPRGYHLAADYHYNGGDLSISENNGKMYISVDGCFWQNEGQYRVLDTSDIGDIRGRVTLHQFLSATDAAWYPLIWGGDSHNNTSDSTGAVYKSYDKLSWQTSSQTLYATNIQTNNIKNLSIGGGIYWNPNVESATDGSDAASITLVRSGVAGGTTLVLSQMNDTNDTIQFKTNTAARLYHNSYPILTTQNTYVSNNKGYINGTEITQVNNADTVDGYHAASFVKMYTGRFEQYNQGTWTKILQFTIPSGHLQPTISFIWHPTECARYVWADFNINIRSGSPIFYVNWKGTTRRTVYCVGDGTTYSVWVQGTKSQWDPFGLVQVISTWQINTYQAGSLQYSDSEPTGTYKVVASMSGIIMYADRLLTARKINGTSFDGTSDITTAYWGTTRTISLTGAITGSVSTNGGGNITINTTYGTGNITNLDNRYVKKAGDTMWGNLTFTSGKQTRWTAHGTSYITDGNVDSGTSLGGDLANLVISSWQGVSFTTSCSGQTYTNKTAVGINCRTGIVYAANFVGPLQGNAATATKLQTSRTIWGQSFDGTGNVSGSLSEVGNIHFKVDNSYDIGSDAAASRYIYTHWLGARSGRKLELGANNSGFGQGLCIDTNLNVGIGTNTPAYKLDVKGDIYSSGYVRASSGFIKGSSSDSYVLLGGGGHKAISDFAISTHTHGLLHSDLTVTLANTTTDSGWSMINSSYNGFLLKSIRTQGSAPNWIENNYAAGICFGGADTKGVVSVAYNRPYIKFAGGNGSKPVWWIRLSGISGATYNLANFNADTLDGVHLNGIFTGFSYAQSKLTATIGTVSKTVNVTGSYPSIGGVTMNTIASYGNCMGMANLASSNSNVNPNNQTSWHHFINMSYNTESTNMWQTQFAIKAGTTEVWVRSRAGGSISDSSAWAAPWVRLARITDNIASATNADMVDGYHENSFLRYRGATYTDQEATLWSQIGIKQYNNALPDNLTGVYNYGSVISLPGFNSRFEIYASHQSSNGNGLYYRSGWGNDKKAWLKFIDSSNIGSQSVNYANSAGHANSAGNADTLGGIPRNYGRAPFGTIPFIGNDGVMEVGRYIDFHNDNNGKHDFSTRLQSTGNYGNGVNLPSASGTLALINDVNNYYWANVKISASSSTTTSPTVHTLTATRVCAGHNPGIDNSISCSNWFRSSGNTGWYNTTYQGGWYMSDTSWIRAHNGVGIYTSGQIYSSSSIRMGSISLEHTDEINNITNNGIHLNYRNSGNVSLCYGGGNVGIGALIPSYKLHVNGQIMASGFHHASHNDDSYVLLAGGGTSHIKHGSTYWSTAIQFGNYVWLMLQIGEASNGISVVPTNISNPTKDIYVMNAQLGKYSNSRHGRYRVAPNGVLYYVDGVTGMQIYTTICYVVNS